MILIFMILLVLGTLAFFILSVPLYIILIGCAFTISSELGLRLLRRRRLAAYLDANDN